MEWYREIGSELRGEGYGTQGGWRYLSRDLMPTDVFHSILSASTHSMRKRKLSAL